MNLKTLLRDAIRNFIVNKLASINFLPGRARVMIYKKYGIQSYGGIFPGCFFTYHSNVSIGEGTWINTKCFFDNYDRITIGKNVGVGPEVMFLTCTHDIGEPSQRAKGPTITKPVHVGDGCWIGARSTILPGVSIGSGCIIAAGSVVTKDCESDALYAGVPAKKIRDLNFNTSVKFDFSKFSRGQIGQEFTLTKVDNITD